MRRIIHALLAVAFSGNSETTSTQNLTTDITSRNSETTSTHIVATGGLTEIPDDGFVLPFYVIAILVFVLGFILAFLHVFWGDWCCNKCRTRKTQRPKRRKADDESSESTEKTSSNNNV